MDTWDTQFPFTADEINLFSRLHQKATKFSAPSDIKPSRNQVDADSQNIQNDNIFEDDSDKQYTYQTANMINLVL